MPAHLFYCYLCLLPGFSTARLFLKVLHSSGAVYTAANSGGIDPIMYIDTKTLSKHIKQHRAELRRKKAIGWNKAMDVCDHFLQYIDRKKTKLPLVASRNQGVVSDIAPCVNPSREEIAKILCDWADEFHIDLLSTAASTDLLTRLSPFMKPDISPGNPLVPDELKCPGQSIKTCGKCGTGCGWCIRNPYHQQTDQYVQPTFDRQQIDLTDGGK